MKKQKTLNFKLGKKREKENIKLRINSNQIKRVTETKYLRLTINQKLKWTAHCNQIIVKLSRYKYIFNVLKNYITIYHCYSEICNWVDT